MNKLEDAAGVLQRHGTSGEGIFDELSSWNKDDVAKAESDQRGDLHTDVQGYKAGSNDAPKVENESARGVKVAREKDQVVDETLEGALSHDADAHKTRPNSKATRAGHAIGDEPGASFEVNCFVEVNVGENDSGSWLPAQVSSQLPGGGFEVRMLQGYDDPIFAVDSEFMRYVPERCTRLKS